MIIGERLADQEYQLNLLKKNLTTLTHKEINIHTSHRETYVYTLTQKQKGSLLYTSSQQTKQAGTADMW